MLIIVFFLLVLLAFLLLVLGAAVDFTDVLSETLMLGVVVVHLLLGNCTFLLEEPLREGGVLTLNALVFGAAPAIVEALLRRRLLGLLRRLHRTPLPT